MGEKDRMGTEMLVLYHAIVYSFIFDAMNCEL